MRDRSVQWCQNKIISVLTRQRQISSYLALSAKILREVRSIDEQHNLDIAVVNLLSRKIINKVKGEDGFTSFTMAA